MWVATPVALAAAGGLSAVLAARAVVLLPEARAGGVGEGWLLFLSNLTGHGRRSWALLTLGHVVVDDEDGTTGGCSCAIPSVQEVTTAVIAAEAVVPLAVAPQHVFKPADHTLTHRLASHS